MSDGSMRGIDTLSLNLLLRMSEALRPFSRLTWGVWSSGDERISALPGRTSGPTSFSSTSSCNPSTNKTSPVRRGGMEREREESFHSLIPYGNIQHKWSA